MLQSQAMSTPKGNQLFSREEMVVLRWIHYLIKII